MPERRRREFDDDPPPSGNVGGGWGFGGSSGRGEICTWFWSLVSNRLLKRVISTFLCIDSK